MTFETPSPKLLSAGLFAAILERVGENVEPPIEWLLVCSATRAYLRGDARKTILDAATAVEVCLIEQMRIVEPTTTTTTKFKGSGIQQRSRWLAAQHPSYEEHACLDVLRKCRNDGIHEGGVITLDDASNGLRAAIATVAALGRSRDSLAK
ncbi:hypothetical protein [Nocardia salmonicida]|uniref:hypothetical protein n=1 Tax=Nocardia salmonicida TaxID=53431 RepID=UPI0037B3275C